MWLCPWFWKELPDSYFPYSGIVVEKGNEIHFITGENHFYRYIIVEDEHGRRITKYLRDYEHARVESERS